MVTDGKDVFYVLDRSKIAEGSTDDLVINLPHQGKLANLPSDFPSQLLQGQPVIGQKAGEKRFNGDPRIPQRPSLVRLEE